MKRGKIDELMDAIGAIDEELIAEAAKVRAGSAAEAGGDAEAGRAGGTENALPAKKRRLGLAALAACLCLAVLTGVYFGSRAGTSDEELPLLDIAPVAAVGMGDSAIGLAGTDLDEFDNGNPWREEMGLKTLPAFKNSRYVARGDGAQNAAGLQKQPLRLGWRADRRAFCGRNEGASAAAFCGLCGGAFRYSGAEAGGRHAFRSQRAKRGDCA